MKSPRPCEGCCKAKCKCDRTIPCARCKRLKLTCRASGESRQGKRKKKRVEDLIIDSIIPSKPTKEFSAAAKNHAGLMWLLRSWLSIAYCRRSIGLLNKSISTAHNLGLTMDDLFDTPQATHLAKIMLKTNFSEEELVGPRLLLSDYRLDMLQSIGAASGLGNGRNWMFGRSENEGVMRWFVTKDFEDDFGLTYEACRAKYIANEEGSDATPFIFCCLENPEETCKIFYNLLGMAVAKQATYGEVGAPLVTYHAECVMKGGVPATMKFCLDLNGVALNKGSFMMVRFEVLDVEAISNRVRSQKEIFEVEEGDGGVDLGVGGVGVDDFSFQMTEHELEMTILDLFNDGSET